MIYEDIDISGSLDISGSWIVPTGTTEQRPSSPLTGSLFYDTTVDRLLEWNGEWSVVGTQASTPFTASADIEYLVVAGGGGGNSNSGGGAGGGAGGLLSSSLSSIQSGSSITVTIGGGGAGAGQDASNGVDSSIASSTGTSFTTVTATGGGAGGDYYTEEGRDGGSGGGGNNSNGLAAGVGGSGTVGQGNDGGDGIAIAVNSGNNASGGGGGAGAAGTDAASGAAGDGGDGKQSAITGTSTYYAGGGGGGTRSSGTAGTGGQGGGGNGRNSGGADSNNHGEANTGGGAGGVRSSPQANGGSGVVILAYDSGSINGAGGIVGDAGSGRKYHQFNSSGTFKAGSTSDFSIVTSSLSLQVDAGNFDSRGTSTWTDLSGNGRNGTTVGSPPLGQNFYYQFDGGDWITFSNDALITDTSYTIQGWIKVTSQSGWNGNFPFYNTYNNSVDKGVWHHFYTNKIAWRHYGASSSYADITGFSLSTNTWTFVSIIYNSSDSTIKVYKNTSLVGSSSSVTGFYAGSDNNNVGGTIGKLNHRSSGTIYDVSNVQLANQLIYTKALTTDEISQNYNATKTNFV